MSAKTDELVVRKSIVVGCTPEGAFRTFTEGIADWWPLATHSVHRERAETVVLEGRVGGRLYERSQDGEKSVWGTITAWRPPERLALTWHPGRGEETAQDVEVSFEADGNATRVQLVHTGWERLPDGGVAEAGNYESGWNLVLDGYVRAAGASG